ncbi:MAG: hypothetical protein PHU33_15950 [Bacteroidales bacterium]|nr:hypothetical protein [Bacteroidales bacterium]
MKLLQKIWPPFFLVAPIEVCRFLSFYLILKYRKFEAYTYWRETGVKHYVMKYGGRPVVVSRAGIKKARRKGLLKKSFDYVDLNEIKLYETPNTQKDVSRKS